MLYLTLKWLHIVAIISWMAGILYLYRLYINHVEKGLKSEEVHDVLCIMEDKLYRIITRPAMLVSWVLGLGILWTTPAYFNSVWLWPKLASVLLLTWSTTYAGGLRARFRDRAETIPTSKALRYMNEGPTILMLIIVAMVVFKP